MILDQVSLPMIFHRSSIVSTAAKKAAPETKKIKVVVLD
jgi:hypothetical protein